VSCCWQDLLLEEQLELRLPARGRFHHEMCARAEFRDRRQPGRVGLTSEGAAHRIAVEWDADEGAAQGVCIPRRDTSSRLTTLADGRLFPGIHQRARFHVEEVDGRYQLALASLDGGVNVHVAAAVTDDLPRASVFRSLAARWVQ
jgi:hypothetical protein